MSQLVTGTLSTVPSQSSSVPGLAHVSVPLGVNWVQVPHALVDLSVDKMHACVPAEQMPLNPVVQDRGALPAEHLQ